MEHNVTELNAPATSNNNNNNNNTSSSVIVQGNPEEGIALGNLSDQQQQQQQQQQEHQSQQQLKENLSQQQIQQEPHQLIRQIPLVQQLQQHQQQQQQQQQQQHFLSHQQPEQQHLHQHQQINPQSQSLLQQQQRHQQIYQKLLTQGSTTTTSTSPSPVSSPPGKTIGRNYNGTMITTSSPSNDAELQLYRVLQRASLLIYYDTLLEMGGDDVQQLCDAGEDEFLEIMALVGMASKPLHVRRLQKVLHEWVNNPSAFQTPLTIPDLSCTGFSPEPCTSRSPFSTAQSYSPSSISGVAASSSGSSNTSTSFGAITTLNTPNQAPNIGSTTSQLQVTASLTEVQIDRLTAGAERLSRELVHMEPRPQSSKKRSTKDLEQVMAMNECNPRRMEEIRKYAAIYGRFDCKRRPEKPLTLHELCVNEAAAQLCKYVPALLTRRDELFPYARQIVRDSGFGHSANISRYPINQQTNTSIESESGNSQTKRLRLSSDTSSEYKDTAEGLRHNLITIYQKLGKAFELPENRRLMNYSRSDYDDNDSRYSFSNSNSPNLQSSNGGVETDSTTTTNDRHFNDTTENLSINNNNNSRISSPEPMDDVKIISSSGSQIIAISNPALALSSSLSSNLQIKNERLSPDII